MSEATLIFPNMRGGCATVDGKVHALFRVNGRRPGLKSLMSSRDRKDQTPCDQSALTTDGGPSET
ncbi:hypothetical protein RPMA_26570 [Tardiphaga alba]|jgi:hypothetical protein|uniref:Uncharacterized protein n=1 Tax=Tardiphaga alba TaxID=340268 RepID=A0ABX8AFD5_9BRAD|nr:hypothetical protein [Tardiphaga alba]QUS41992.1 hypothetical protein RPMA_26570 [Tardiphaga alba]